MPDSNFYQALLKNSPTLISTHSGDGVFITVEDACFDVLGYTKEELLGTPIFQYFHPDEMEYHQNEVGAKFGAQQEFVPTLSRFRRKDGGYTWFQSMLHVSYNDDGSISNIFNTQFDITKWVEMRIGLQEQEAMLFESGSLAQVGAWKVNLETGEQFWTPSNFEIFDLEVGKPPKLKDLLDFMEDREKAKETIALAVTANKTIQEEFNICTDKGRLKTIRTIVKPIIQDKKVVGLLGACQDITDDQAIRSKLELSIKSLKARKKKLEDFNQIVSHNLRSPVGNIRMLIELYKKEDTPEGKAKALEFLETTALNLEEQLNELMGIVEIVNRKEVNLERVNVEDSLSQILTGLNGFIAQTAARFETNLEWKEIEYSKTYFDSILLNLVSNSLKYNKPDRDLEIFIKTGFKNGRKTLSVSDNGLGINLKLYGDKLFKLRSNVHRERRGNGIGLFYTKEQVESLGGTITVESEEWKGSTFTVIF